MKPKLIISNYDDIHNPYYGGGGARALFEIGRHLTKDYQVIMITGKFPKSKNEIIQNVYFKRIGTNIVGPKLGQLIYQFLLPFYALILNYNVWLESFTPPFSTACLQLFTKKPVIGITQILSGNVMKEKYTLPFNKIEEYGLKTYNRVIVLNESIKTEILKYNPNINIVVIPNGISNEIIEMKVIKQSKYILYLGRIDYYQKGLDLLLSAYDLIKDEIKYDLYIAGSGTYGDILLLKNRIKELNIDNRVNLKGYVDGDEKYSLLSDAAFVVIPSRYETFGIIALEAICFKAPVIVFDIEGFKWIPNDFSVKVNIGDVKAFSFAIKDLSNNKSLRDSKSINGKEFAKQYEWSKIAEKYKNYINKAINHV